MNIIQSDKELTLGFYSTKLQPLSILTCLGNYAIL
jgi:hypothetical protein